MSSLLRRLHLPTKTMRLGLTTKFHSSFYSSSSSSSSSSSFSNSQSPTLTDSELTKINNLIPHLCASNQLPTALRLTTTALSTNPSLSSLNLSPLINSLTTPPKFTLTSPPISLMLLNSYLQTHNSSNHALKLLRWLQRPNSPCTPDATMYRLVIVGLCRDGLLLHAVNAFRDMVGDLKLVPCADSAQFVYQGLLTEARVNQALELDAAFSMLARDQQERDTFLHVLDRIIADWTE